MREITWSEWPQWPILPDQQDGLVHIALNPPWGQHQVALSAVNSVTDVNLLLTLAREARGDPEVQNLAAHRFIVCAVVVVLSRGNCLPVEMPTQLPEGLEQLTDQQLLSAAALASSDLLVRGEIIQKLTDELTLAKLAVDDDGSFIGTNAISKITDKELLRKIATTAKNKMILFGAMWDVPDLQDALAEIVLSNPGAEGLEAAIGLKDPQALFKVAKNTENPDRYIGAIGKLKKYDTDRDLIAKLVFDARTLGARRKALDILRLSSDPKHQRISFEVALLDNDAEMRRRAVSAIDDQELNFEVLQKSQDLEVRRVAFAALSDNALLKLANDNGLEVPLALAAKYRLSKLKFRDISDQLTQNAVSDDVIGFFVLFDQVVLKTGLSEFTEDNVIEILLRPSSEFSFRKLAFSRVTSASGLEKLAQNTVDPAVSLAAKIRLAKTDWNEITQSAQLQSVKGNVVGAMALLPEERDYGPIAEVVALSYIREGSISRLPELVEILNIYGTITLGEDYLNCGKTELASAANAGHATWIFHKPWRGLASCQMGSTVRRFGGTLAYAYYLLFDMMIMPEAAEAAPDVANRDLDAGDLRGGGVAQLAHWPLDRSFAHSSNIWR